MNPLLCHRDDVLYRPETLVELALLHQLQDRMA